MTYETFYGSHEHFKGWRCILCGEIIDQVILENRRARMDNENRKRRGDRPDNDWEGLREGMGREDGR